MSGCRGCVVEYVFLYDRGKHLLPTSLFTCEEGSERFLAGVRGVRNGERSFRQCFGGLDGSGDPIGSDEMRGGMFGCFLAQTQACSGGEIGCDDVGNDA